MQRKKVLSFAICVLVLLSVVRIRPIIAKAIFGSSTDVDAVSVSDIDMDGVENSTLIIGTHLIYLYALSDELYQIALDSASDFGQERIYYKSELADGTWFDITDAGSVNDIVDSGTVADAGTLAELYVTHHTKPDGITYDLRTGRSVCIFDIYDVYDLENMPELEPLKIRYDIMKGSGDGADSGNSNISRVRDFFAQDISDEEAAACDSDMEALQKYYEELEANNAAKAETETVLGVMKKVDNLRKEIVFEIIEGSLSDLQDTAAGIDGSDSASVDLDDALLTAIASSQSNISDSRAEAQSNLLEEGDLILSAKEYELDNTLIAASVDQDYQECDTSVGQLIYLSNITDGLIVSPTAELQLIEELITKGTEKYQAALSKGPSDEYLQAAANKSSHALLNNIISSEIAEVNSARSELEFFVEARAQRLENKDAQEYVSECLSGTSQLIDVIPNDSYRDAMEESVEGYRDWLKSLLAQLKSEDRQSKGQSLYEEKEALQNERLAALDDEDIDLANLLEAMIETVDGKISAFEKAKTQELVQQQEQLAALKRELAMDPGNISLQNQIADMEEKIEELASDLSGESAAANIRAVREELLSHLKDKDTSDAAMDAMELGIDGLGAMADNGSPLALSALKEIYTEMVARSYLDDIAGYETLIAKIEDTVANADVPLILEDSVTQEAALSALGEALGGTIQVSGTGGSGQVSGDDDVAALTVEGISDKELLAAVLALDTYADESGNEDLEALVQGMAASLAQSQDAGVFEEYTSGTMEYVPADILAEFTGYRYLWNETKKTAVLSKGREYYRFRAFYSGVEKSGEEKEFMDTEAQFEGGVYIPASYAKSVFGCEICGISNTGYSLLANDKVMEQAKELASVISGEGGVDWEFLW